MVEAYQHAKTLVLDRRDTGLTFGAPAEILSSRPLTGSLGALRFSETLGTFQLSNSEGAEIITPELAIEQPLEKLNIVADGTPLQQRQTLFNRPFNPMFIPAEYATINCCPECTIRPPYCPDCDPPPPPPPDFTVTSPQQIFDSQTATYVVSVTSGTATSYQWSFTAPSTAGNNPHVTFSSPTTVQTNTDGHWFALPNDPCGAASNSIYQITATVDFDDGSQIAHGSTLIINGSWDPAGQTDQNVSTISGAPAMAPDAQGVWHITGLGTMARVVPTSSTIFVLSTSQFYNKTAQHEQVHVAQWNPGRLAGDLFIPTDLFNSVQSLTGTSQADLLANYTTQLGNYRTAQLSVYNSRRTAIEHEAYTVSDLIAPAYLYQNCGRF
jgi:hypothetical protein